MVGCEMLVIQSRQNDALKAHGIVKAACVVIGKHLPLLGLDLQGVAMLEVL